jgi:hypothetical protein
MALSPRFALDTAAVLGGGFLAVSAMAFSVPVAGWIGFGVSTAAAVAGATGAVLARRGSTRIGHGALGVVGLWSLIAALVFAGTALHWLVFADALLLAAVAVGDLVAHELSSERVVHSLEVHHTEAGSNTVAGSHAVTV